MQPAPVRLRPMTISDILDAVFRLYRDNFLTFIGVVALLQVPMLILQISVTFALGNQVLVDMMQLTRELPFFDPEVDPLSELPLGSLMLYVAISMVIGLIQAIVIQQLINGALANAIARRYLNQPVSILEAYSFGIERIAALIIAGIIITLIGGLIIGVLFGCTIGFLIVVASAGQDSVALAALTIFATIITILIAILIAAILLLRFLFTTQAIVLEGRGPIDAMGRSWRMMRGSFWRVLGIVALVYILVQIITIVPSVALGGVIGAIFNRPEDFAIQQSLSTLVGYLIQIVALPLQLSAFTLLYYDLRVRKEGYDMQMMAGALEGGE